MLAAGSGREAFVIAQGHAGPIHLLITDVVLPPRGGVDLARRLTELRPELRVLFISGYAEAEFSDLLEGETGVTFLPKPLDIKALAERVKQQLAGG